MDAVLLADIGSTFTKVYSVDLDHIELIGRAQAPTTVHTDVMDGFERALFELKTVTGAVPFSRKLICSSAAGGLEVAVSGLVESLTLKAARHAALGAGAKVIRGFHHELTNEDLGYIREHNIDIFLLAGGTDGGNKEVIINNARHIAGLGVNFPVVVAGNRNASDQVTEILKNAGMDVFVCPNILPDLETMETGPVNNIIRQIFMDRIIKAKGISALNELSDNDIVPTPYAVLKASKLLSEGAGSLPGLGCLMTIDAGGATTDVHSICDGYTRDDVLYEGLPEPRVMRTVEGDIGVRWNIDSILALMGDFPGNYSSFAKRVRNDPSVLFGPEGAAFETEVAAKAVETAVGRHCGTLTKQFTPRGARFVQKGKDMTGTKALVATGGPVSRSLDPLGIIKGALFNENNPESLRPENPDIYIDSEYIMASAGLLSEISEEKALIYMNKYLRRIETGVLND